MVKRALATTFDLPSAAGLFGFLLAGELAFGLLLVAADRVPSIAVRALQLFLRF